MTLVYDIYIHSYLWQFCEHDSDVLNKPCMIRAEVEHSLDVNDLEAAELTNVFDPTPSGCEVHSHRPSFREDVIIIKLNCVGDHVVGIILVS